MEVRGCPKTRRTWFKGDDLANQALAVREQFASINECKGPLAGSSPTTTRGLGVADRWKGWVAV